MGRVKRLTSALWPISLCAGLHLSPSLAPPATTFGFPGRLVNARVMKLRPRQEEREGRHRLSKRDRTCKAAYGFAMPHIVIDISFSDPGVDDDPDPLKNFRQFHAQQA
ncbi:hypothetical protein BD311DRAFT_311252 [Dichomitus squalens]|uniref:Uncharacterized protein n=1 Tax=Dichomitus squalens TaxID=114155 RepID=A0A4Q9MMG6_9APHY|nr:hypothetical protein BD311DRAFT_311252 [Dichomitus squalens]